MKIRAVTFDIGHTLLFPQPSLGHVYSRTALRHGIDIAPAEAEERFLLAWRHVQAEHRGLFYGTDHATAKASWMSILLRMFAGDSHPAEATLWRFLNDLYLEFSLPRAWRINAHWESVRGELRNRGLRLGLISNWDIRLRDLLAELGLLARFDAVLISAEVAVEKPEAAIFAAAADRLEVAPAEILHIGDAWREDVCGAKAAGLQAVWFNPGRAPLPADSPPAHQARELPELLALV